MSQQPALKPEIGVVGLWALAVGLVISGEYFGWSYGWAAAGTVGFLWTTLIIAVLYLAFIFSFTELTAAIPDAGGPFEYARRAFGPFGGLIAGLVVLAFGVMILAGGAGDWSRLSGIDYPLPEAMAMIVGKSSAWIHMLVTIGLFGLLASFHGIILSCSRQIFGLARAGYLPAALAAVHERRRTPHVALVATGVFGIVALATGRTSELITLSALGAPVMYICSMLALFRLRRTAPELDRPFRAPLYPALPFIALALSILSLGVIVWFNPGVAGIFVGGFVLAAVYFRATAARRAR